MTMTKIALLLWTTDLVIWVSWSSPFCGRRPQNVDDHDTQMTKIGRPKNEGHLGHGHRLFTSQSKGPLGMAMARARLDP